MKKNPHYCVAIVIALTACTTGSTISEIAPSPELPTNTLSATDQPIMTTLVSQTLEPPTLTPIESPSKLPDTTEAPVLKVTPSVFPAAGPALAFLRGGDIWLLEEPGGEPYPLTVAGDILGFTWAPNGERLAAFNGHTLCFYHRDGSIRTACLDLGLDDQQAKIERRLVLSPDQRWIVLWNPINPQDEGAIGWMIVALDTSNIMYRIEDPVEWGAELEPEGEAGGFTGMPLFLKDGNLIGTLSHRSWCGSGGCHYQLFQFGLQTRTFIAFDNDPLEGFSEGQGLQLSQDGQVLTNFGTFFNDCDSYATFVDLFNLSNGQRQIFNLENIAVSGLTFDPDLNRGIIASTSACSISDQVTWSSGCGLIQEFEVLPMQIWNLNSGERTDMLPGLAPISSPDGEWLVFRSCLDHADNGEWEQTEASPPKLYLLHIGGEDVLEIGEGLVPEWQP